MVVQPATPGNGNTADLVLKVTPPRAPRDLVARDRLRADTGRFRDCPIVLVQAAAGFGKTSLLAQWRLEHLARGAVVAWLSCQPGDDADRLVHALVLTVRAGSGRPTFGHTLMEGAASPGQEGITTWLGDVALSAMDLVLFVEDADRLPAASRDSLSYLLHNAPSNLRVVVSARVDCDLGIADLVAYGHGVVIGTEALRFTLEETLALARQGLEPRIDTDAAARLHELTEGWPLGLRIALSALAHGADPAALADATAARAPSSPAAPIPSGLHDRFVGLLVANLEPGDAAFLERIALVDHLHPDLCHALTGDDGAPERLARLARETPVFAAGEGSEWLRMHGLARDALRARATQLPDAERAGLHARASQWFAGRGMLEDAARHALAAGQSDVAYDLAERCLYDGMMRHGHVGAVLDWLRELPNDELDRRPRLLLAASWALAVSGRHREAEALVERVAAHGGGDPAVQGECALIVSGAAVLADDPDRYVALHDPWDQSPAPADPMLLHVRANRRAFRALVAGDPAAARRCQQEAPRADFGGGYAHLARWGDLVTALTYLWEGQVVMTENLVRPVLAAVEAELGRRDPMASMLAVLLAAAVWEQDRPQAAVALLANRLDVLERAGLPDCLMLGYRTAARIAVAEGSEPRALALLEALHEAGRARSLPRLEIASLAEQVRLHARRYRGETCAALVERIDAVFARPDVPQGPLWQRSADLLRQSARAFAAIGARDWRASIAPLAGAAALAAVTGLRRVQIELMALRAFALENDGQDGRSPLREAIDLATTFGLARLFVDAHPALGEWAARVRELESHAPAALDAAFAAPSRPREPAAPKATPSMALTPKERGVLELLARNLSNKEIALALQVGEETIKWHLKNLFGKLSAGNRKHAVRRARLLGLLEPGT